MIGVAAGLGEHVDLRALMSELGGVDADLYFELLNGIDRGKDDVGVEIRVGIIDAVETVVVVHDALAPRGYGLSGAVATLSGCGLSRRWRERVHIGRKRDQAEVIAAVKGQVGDDP